MIRLTLHLLAQPFVQSANFSGRARRAEFWLLILSLLVVVNVTPLLMETVLHQGNGPHKFAYIGEGMRDGGSFRFEYDGEWKHGEWKQGMTFDAISDWLNERGYLTERGKKLRAAHVHSILKKRLAKEELLKREYPPIWSDFSMEVVDKTILMSDFGFKK